MRFQLNWSALYGGLVLAALAALVAGSPEYLAGVIDELGAKSTSVVVSSVAIVMVFYLLGRAVYRSLTVQRFTVASEQPTMGSAIVSAGIDAPADVLHNVARHEAAHAVVAIATGGTVRSAVVRPGMGDYNGRVESHSDDAPWEDVRFMRMTVAIAGHVADQLAGVHDEGSMSDLNTVHISALSIVSMGMRPSGYPADRTLTVEGLLQAAQERAKDILTEHSDGAERIASLLVENKYRIVPGSKVHAAFDGTTGES